MNIIDVYLQELQAGKVLRKKAKQLIDKAKKAVDIANDIRKVEPISRRQFLKRSAKNAVKLATI